MSGEIEFPIQQVWRTMSSSHSGYYIWDVTEVIGGPMLMSADKISRIYHTAADGSLLFVQCFHFFTEKQAQEHMAAVSFSQEVNIVP